MARMGQGGTMTVEDARALLAESEADRRKAWALGYSAEQLAATDAAIALAGRKIAIYPSGPLGDLEGDVLYELGQVVYQLRELGKVDPAGPARAELPPVGLPGPAGVPGAVAPKMSTGAKWALGAAVVAGIAVVGAGLWWMSRGARRRRRAA